MIEALDRGEQLPIDIKDATIYYMGPSPAREGRPIGSAGPTTATRMDKYAPTLLDLGEKAMIGKGKRSKEVIDAIIRNHAVLFVNLFFNFYYISDANLLIDVSYRLFPS